MTLEEAEALTETIRRALDDGDEMCLELLAAGVPPSRVAAVVLESWERFREEFTDAEVTDAMWTYIIGPRVEAILGWQPAGTVGGGS